MQEYLPNILNRIPQVLSQIDRESFSRSYGSGDRLHWCWKFTDFDGPRFQEFLFTISWMYTATSFDNPWRGNRHLLDVTVAGFERWDKLQHRDGSFDEAYPFERSFAATAFTLFYCSEAYVLVQNALGQDAKDLFFRTTEKAATWLCENDEHHGFLSNHVAAAAAALTHAGDLLENETFAARARTLVDRILEHQSPEGWYEEYGGADIGYQTHGTFYLARVYARTRDDTLLRSLKKANDFLSHFIHPDGSLGGEYAARNTMFYFPAAYEALAPHCASAAAIAHEMRPQVARGRTVGLPQMDAQNLLPMMNSYIFAHEARAAQSEPPRSNELPFTKTGEWSFPDAGLVVRSTDRYYAVVGASKGGVVRVWSKATGRIHWQSSGYVTRERKKWLSNQSQGLATFCKEQERVEVRAPFASINQKLFGPWLFIAFRLFTLTVGRSSLVGRLLKRVLVDVLVRRKRASKLVLRRSITLGTDEILIGDQLSDAAVELLHLEKFSTIHMGSSRYVHLEEEQLGGQSDLVELEFDRRGLLLSARIRFP